MTTVRCKLSARLSFAIIVVSTASLTAQDVLPSTSQPIIIDSTRKEVRLSAIYHSSKFEGLFKFVPNYHLLVWSEGGAASESLFSTTVADTILIDALEAVGGVAGNNLTMAAWDKRNDANHPAPQIKIAGTPVDLFVGWKGLESPWSLSELLEDPGEQGFDFRFGGNRDLIEHWHSGCLVCLYSCPGSKVGNAAYTVRDYVTGATKFKPKRNRLPKNRDEVVIYFRIREASSGKTQ